MQPLFLSPRSCSTYIYDDVTYVYDDVTYVYDDVTYVYDDVTYAAALPITKIVQHLYI